MTRETLNLVLEMSPAELLMWANLGGEIPVGRLGIIAAARAKVSERKPVIEQRRHRHSDYGKRRLWPVHKRSRRRARYFDMGLKRKAA